MSEDIKIENNVPMPPERPKFKEHLDRLDLSQSFRVEIKNWSSLRNAAANMNRKTNKQFITKKVRERRNRGAKYEEFARVWRTK